MARALSKRGYCSRSESEKLVRAGRVSVNDEIQRDPSWRVDPKHDRIHVNGTPVKAEPKIYLMLNKPRGLITTASDEQRRDTVYDCLANANLPHVFPVGRLDKASEGLLLFTNDTQWANAITNPATHLDKVYHVQVDCLADEALVQRLLAGTQDGDDFLQAKDAHLLRMGTRNSWLEIVLDEGKNRHIRRLLVAQGVSVLRLVRVAIGPLVLGDLEKGKYRYLTQTEVKTLSNHTKFDSYSALE
ncbi:MAG: rRNA pseudouridine synthase [Anaerolineae bacterium]|nr:rRNA pseudouridine synthase [Anaerolineae bacterium]